MSLSPRRPIPSCNRLPICCAVKLPPAPAIPGVEKIWGHHSQLWPQKQTLRVRFLRGSKAQKRAAWERFMKIGSLINLTFKQVESGKSEIRVAFAANGGHWSYVGNDCLGISQLKPTMNLALRAGVFGDAADEWDRVALHEVCHAIGMLHEHQHPLATIPWDEAKVIAYYERTQGWSEQEIRYQVLNRESMSADFIGTAFDGTSIMEYPVPKELTRNGFSVGWNRALSTSDVLFLRKIYPINADA